MIHRRALGAFTILEVTIALAVVAALAALALPPLDRWLREGAFRAACDRLEAGLERCRAESLRGAVAVAAVCRARHDGTWEVIAKVVGENAQVAAADANDPSGSSAAPNHGADRVVATLERGISLTRRATATDAAGEGRGAAEPEPEFVVAFFFPDGSAAGEPGARALGAAGQTAEFLVNSWTGEVTVSEVSVGSRDPSPRGTDVEPPPEPSR